MFRNASNAVAYHFQFFTPVGLRQFLRKAAGSFDIAHLHACHNLPVVIAAWELTRAGVPYVVSPNGTAPAIERRMQSEAAVRHDDRTIAATPRGASHCGLASRSGAAAGARDRRRIDRPHS